MAATTEMPPTTIWIGGEHVRRASPPPRGRCREEHRLSVGPRVADDPIDAALVPIEHPISFVQHDVGDAAEVGDAAMFAVSMSIIRRACTTMCGISSPGDLLLEVGASVDGGDARARRLREPMDLAVDLHREPRVPSRARSGRRRPAAEAGPSRDEASAAYPVRGTGGWGGVGGGRGAARGGARRWSGAAGGGPVSPRRLAVRPRHRDDVAPAHDARQRLRLDRERRRTREEVVEVEEEVVVGEVEEEVEVEEVVVVVAVVARRTLASRSPPTAGRRAPPAPTA